ncbi:hypothetical protein BC828DRAFT_389741 [Blastocladiella britannica]|nr:hypothetical protein BC828DRAFT_389741 [Blastocladiella britannica]
MSTTTADGGHNDPTHAPVGLPVTESTTVSSGLAHIDSLFVAFANKLVLQGNAALAGDLDTMREAPGRARQAHYDMQNKLLVCRGASAAASPTTPVLTPRRDRRVPGRVLKRLTLGAEEVVYSLHIIVIWSDSLRQGLTVFPPVCFQDCIQRVSGCSIMGSSPSLAST